MSKVKIHKFQPTQANQVRFQMYEPTKKEKKDGELPELRIDDTGTKFRTKRVSGIFYLREGGPHDPDPRTLWRIYEIRRESWLPASLTFNTSSPPRVPKNLLANTDKLYGERAVPFSAILEVASGLPSRKRVHEQLDNHHRRLVELGESDARAKVQAEIAAEKSSGEKKKLEADLKLTEVYTAKELESEKYAKMSDAKKEDLVGKRKKESLRLELIDLVAGSAEGKDDLE
jgi:hypothetical protein